MYCSTAPGAPPRGLPDMPPAAAEAESDSASSSSEPAGGDAEPGRRECCFAHGPTGVSVRSASKQPPVGAVVSEVERKAELLGVRTGDCVERINGASVERLPTPEIQSMLDATTKTEVRLTLRAPLNLPRVEARQKQQRPSARVSVCTAGCRSSWRVLRRAVARLGWQEIPHETREASVVWLEHNDPTDGLAPSQTVSRLDALLAACRKAPLSRSLAAWSQELPQDFDFVPKTWILPRDAADLEAHMHAHKCTYIAKPTASSQGKGIVIARKWRDLTQVVREASVDCASREYCVQRYVSRPLLIDGLKFDLRLFLVVTSVVPLRAYLFQEGLGRFCTTPYEIPNDSNVGNATMHLTNFAVNRVAADFAPASAERHMEGSKRSASSVFDSIESSGGPTKAAMWEQLRSIAAKTLTALRPQLIEWYVDKRKALHPAVAKGFQVLGFDVIIDSRYRPRLLEINANSSLSITQPGMEGDARQPEARGSRDCRESRVRERSLSRTRLCPLKQQQRRNSSASMEEVDPRVKTISGLDEQIKTELVCQALLCVAPLPHRKAVRQRRRWLCECEMNYDGYQRAACTGEPLPLSDSGEYYASCHAPRPDAFERCPALVPLDWAAVPAACREHSERHLLLCRTFRAAVARASGQLGRPQLSRMLERVGLIGNTERGCQWDRASADVLLVGLWRTLPRDADGRPCGSCPDFPTFLRILAHLGRALPGRSGDSDITAIRALCQRCPLLLSPAA
eukprot:TRINITY_DN23898_c0_g1_i1.p1 TRINITY_DN23898_c0_g1~~TRINITY_DN23898_c0_g1_i1.p1  ORF type:complete len:741 (+),score=158.91 TRINITY_DN23898_c0_g1_i1:76-2298(+)